MNVASIEIAQPAFNPKGVARAGGVSLPALSTQHLVGFLSLLNRLLDPSEPSAEDGWAALPGRRAGGVSVLPQVASEKEKGKAGRPAATQLDTALLRPQATAGNAETPIPIQPGDFHTGRLAGEGLPIPTLGETQDSRTQPQPLSLPMFLATGVASGHPDPTSIAVGSASDLAFALRLTWQPPAIATAPLAAHAEPQVALPGKPPGAVNDIPNFPQTAPAGFIGIDSTMRDDAARFPEMLAVIHPGNASGSSTAQNRGDETDPSSLFMDSSKILSCSEYSARLPNMDSPAQEPIQAPARIAGKTVTEASVASTNQNFQAETADQAEGRMAVSGAARHVPQAAIASPPGTTANDSPNPTERDAGSSESDGQASRFPLAQKLSAVQASQEHAGTAADGVLLGSPNDPNDARQTPTKISATQPPQAPTVSPEVETTRAVQSQPIREISFRLAGAASAQVDVQVAERAGRVQVAVRTADPDLAKSLQSNLGDLMGHLEEQGFRTEAWTPATAQQDGSPVRETSNSANSRSFADNPGFSGGQQNSQQGQRESNQRQPGRWKAQLEETSPASTTRAYEEERP